MNKVLLSSQFYCLMLSVNTQPITYRAPIFEQHKPTPPHVKSGRGKRKGWKK